MDGAVIGSGAVALNLVVLGMHRSGTSAMAQVLRAAGFSSGGGTDLLVARPDNPGGFVERPDVVRINDDLLASLGWTWDSPDASPSPLDRPREAFVRAARDLVATHLDPRAPWVIKDPRISILLPWWRRILLDRFVAVVVVRPAAEVAWSLWVRDGLSIALGHALWAAYHRHLAVALEGLPVVVVDYAALTERPEEVTRSVLSALGELGVEVPLGDGAPWEAVDARLRRGTHAAGLGFAEERLAAMSQAWSMGPVRSFERFSLPVEDPSAWEVGLLDLQRQVRSLELLRDLARADAEEARRRLEAALAGVPAARGDTGAGDSPPGRPRTAGSEVAPGTPPRGQAPSGPAPRTEAPAPRTEVPGPAPAAPRRTSRRSRRALGDLVLRARLKAGLPNPLFDRGWYATRYPDVSRSRWGAWVHWRRHGWREGRAADPWFDAGWYLARYPDVRAAGQDPLAHYLLHGWHEGRNPGPAFDGTRYLARHPDVRRAQTPPLLHYLRHGHAEGRVADPVAPGGR